MTEVTDRLKNGGQVRSNSYRCPNETNNNCKGDCASSVTTTARAIGKDRKIVREGQIEIE